jgi:hypothetical protein
MPRWDYTLHAKDLFGHSQGDEVESLESLYKTACGWGSEGFR